MSILAKMHFFIIGFMGSGKSTLGRQLAGLLNISFVDLDDLIESAENESIKNIFQSRGEAWFRRRETEELTRASESSTSQIIICGGGTPCSVRNKEVMKKTGKIILIEANLDLLVERVISEKDKRPLLAHIPEEDLKNRMEELLQQRKSCYADFDFKYEEGITDLLKFADQVKQYV